VVGVRGQVHVEVDDHVDVGDAVGELRIADVGHAPGDPGHVSAVVVEADDLPDVPRVRQPGDQRTSDAVGRPRDGDDRPRATPWANLSCTQVE
jgi:hypothetical protein